MAGSGIKATTQLTAASITSYTLLYSVPTGFYGVYNISFTNTTAASANIRIFIGASTASVSGQIASEAFEYQTTVVGYGVFERTGLVLQPAANIVISSSGTAMNVNIYGIETSTT
jgi:hypothetical protein